MVYAREPEIFGMVNSDGGKSVHKSHILNLTPLKIISLGSIHSGRNVVRFTSTRKMVPRKI